MVVIILSISILFIIGLLLKNKIAIRIKNLFNSSATKILDNATDKTDLLNLKVSDLESKRKEIIKSVAKMKSNELRNDANLLELQTTITSYITLAKKYKSEEEKEKCIDVLTKLHIKETEFNTLTKINDDLKVYILEGEKQLQIFKNNIIAINSKVAITENKKVNAEALSVLSGLNEKDEDLNKLIDSANIEYDTTRIASETLLSENNIDYELDKIDINTKYDNL